MTTPQPNRRWCHFTPARFLAGLLAVQVFLLLSKRFQWFAFNEYKGWTVLIAVGVVGLAVLVMLVWGVVCLLLRRRFQFSFRSLLVFLVAVSVPLGWFAWEMRQARRQRVAVEKIWAMRGEVQFEHEYECMWGLGGTYLEWTPKPRARQWLRSLLGDDAFSKAIYADCGWRGFRDVDMPYFDALSSLQYLVLSGSDITDTGVAHLRGLRRLQVLELAFTQLTDAGLDHLKDMTDLKYLRLDRTRVTDEGVKKLQQALPDCHITHFQP